MMNLGISREDLELFQQDEMFLDVDLDTGRDCLLPDLTDEILSYVQESLRKRSVWGQTVFSCRWAKLGEKDYSCPTTLIHQPSMEQSQTPHLHSTTVLLHQPSTSRPHSSTVPQCQSQIQPPQLPVVHPLSVHHYRSPPHYPQQPIPQQCLHTQPHPQATQQQQQSHLNGQVLPNQQQQQLCNRLKHMQVTGTGSITQRQKDITKQQQQIPPLFNVEQPGGLQTHHGHPQHGHLCLGEASLELPYRNQLNTLSVSRSSVLSSYVPTTGLQSQGVDGELMPQNLEELLGSLESSGPRGTEDGRGALQWSVVEALGVFQQQRHLPDDLAQSQATSRGCAQHAYPLSMGLSQVNRAEWPFTTQFQNGSLKEAGPAPGPVPNPGSSRGADHGHAAAKQPIHQPPPPSAESTPYPDLPLSGFM
uniref:aryl hydrocarbon receptor-like n=1 Tax=Oncorhynchus gorbuscha TaxID=8017 RepID=UPI001EAE8F7C|nr:aryl hydrocarbon receptor-like [Oncorhynchus gorbuscha]